MKNIYSRRYLLRIFFYTAAALTSLKIALLNDSNSNRAESSGGVADNLSAASGPLQAILDRLVTGEKVPGATMYISTPGGSWGGAAGIRSLETKEKMKPDDVFSIASTSKTFVAAVTLQLVDENKINLDRAIDNYLPPDVSGRVPYSDKITVRQS